MKRTIRFYDKVNASRIVYDTAIHGGWTLAALTLSPPERVDELIELPGRDGSLDVATVITGGEPVYRSRTLTIALESSEGTRADRTALTDDLTNRLDGFEFRIELPDDPAHYLVGIAAVSVEYNDVNHARAIVTVICDPWRYAVAWVFMELQCTASDQLVILKNNGRKRVKPALSAYVSGGGVPDVTVSYGNEAWTIYGNAVAPDELAMGYHDEKGLTYSGSGTLVIRYREAIL